MPAIVATSRTPDVLRELGARLKTLRLQQNLRVQDLAADSGVSPRTIDRLEAGHSVGTENLIRVMRGLGRLQSFEAFVPVPEVSPYEIARLRGKVRQRASRRVRD
ncbi:MAG: helix-turn-helix transcriptional regulator [Gammaproteobacteria bacterium]|nr:helix-turn-helix transcriptional regulator [Gammaproteobacteria bacterium]MDE0260020.1 helix-turn-helix transcriptional regulator [Gammaproteobacteria bacterium]